jgi:uncharacterized membrane protein YphA (DoxX/SURF4 family)
MNYRNPKVVTVIRIVFGLFMLFSGISGLMAASSLQGIPEPMIPTMKVLIGTGIFYMIKVTEVIAGLMLVVGFLPALAAIFLAPICIGVIIVNSRIAPNFVITGVIVSLINGYLGYAYWDKYKALFVRKWIIQVSNAPLNPR